MATQVLVVDDEKMIVKGIRYALEHDGYEVETAYDGETALDMIKNKAYDLIVLDVMLPKLDGIQVCQMVREFSEVPIIMLTAKSEDMDKILGLEYGADDYMTKPFNILELKARIKAIIRRSHGTHDKKENVLEIGGLKINLDSRQVFTDGKEVNLTAKEFDLLELLARNAGKVYSREKLLDVVWGYDYPGDERTVDVHVRRLREKIEPRSSEPTYIQTKWGVGYFFKD
ncbi:MAG: response regulator transcription factor [Firmicutes bacterium]|nr:response regulator transcription factor [Bacillota bacterium]